MIALVAFALVAPSFGHPLSGVPDANLHVALVELNGPFDELELRCGMARTLVRGPLGAGERRLVRVPFLGSGGGDRPPTAEPPSDRALFRAWEDGDRARRLESLPRGLRSRPPPALERSRPRPRASALVALVGAGILVVLLRQRTRTALIVSSAAAALLAAPLVVAAPDGTPVRVLEGDAESRRWVWVEAAFGSIELDGEDLLALSVHPEPDADDLGAEVRLGEPWERWTLCARGRRLVALVEAPAFDRIGRIDARRNDLADLALVWIRPAAGGSFEARGAWPRGTPLPTPPSAAAPPPGWLAAGLPPGVAVLVAGLGSGVAGGAVQGPEWLRLVGFPTESR